MQSKERARVEMGGEDQTEVEQTVAITTEALTPVWNDIRESETSRKGRGQVAG